MSQISWTPPASAANTSALAAFAGAMGFGIGDYDSLHRWSIGEPGAFWSAVWDFCGLVGDRSGPSFVPDAAHWMTGARFFPEARINLAENLLRRTGKEVVVIEQDETGWSRETSADDLRAEVARVAAALRRMGVQPGDRVAAILPNRRECLVTVLATAALGAVWTSCSPDFGAAAIIDRIGQVKPRVLFVQPHIRYGGKAVDIADKAAEIVAGIEGLECVIVVGAGEVSSQVDTYRYDDLGPSEALHFTRVGFNDPVYILYSSGTTGAPKAIVHRTGGVLLQKIKEHVLHGDVRPGDRVLWYSNTAWMMYHWVIAVLACEATLVLYDGAPILKTESGFDCGPLWRTAEATRLTHLGISPKYLSTLADAGYTPRDRHDLSSLRWLLSAGSPVGPHQYDWIYQAIDPDIGFASISGGTEIMGCFLLGSPLHPVRRGQLTVRGLGMAVAVVDDRNAPIIGRPGDLVCTEPFPSMPLTFWGEDGDARYHNTYFSDRREIWTHGDHATLTADGSAVIHGRSDFTLNPGGVRIGTADIYNVCERFAEIDDCIVFGRPIAGDEEIVLCLKLAGGAAGSDEFAAKLRREIRNQCSPRHVPAAIYMVADIPYTLNGKRVEGAAKAVATGLTVKNRASLANESCLAEYGELSGRAAL